MCSQSCAAHASIQPLSLAPARRASLALFRASQAYAAVHGQLYVKPDDVKALAIPALAHRLTLTAQSRVRQLDAEQVVRDVLEQPLLQLSR